MLTLSLVVKISAHHPVVHQHYFSRILSSKRFWFRRLMKKRKMKMCLKSYRMYGTEYFDPKSQIPPILLFYHQYQKIPKTQCFKKFFNNVIPKPLYRIFSKLYTKKPIFYLQQMKQIDTLGLKSVGTPTIF